MNSFTLSSPAKLNLDLKILRQRSDNYHELESTFQLIDLCDHMEFSIIKNGDINIVCEPDFIELEQNIVFKAAKILQDRFKAKEGVYIRLNKEIPLGGGLGGGSSNAATTLVALNKLWGLKIPFNDLLKIGGELGSDVPFFLNAENAFISGIGDKIKNKNSENSKYILIMPNIQISTKKIFEYYSSNKQSITNERRIGSQNSLLESVLRNYPEIESFYDKNIPFFDIKLTGTGSTMFIEYKEQDVLEKILQIIPINWRFFLAEAIQYSPLRGMK